MRRWKRVEYERLVEQGFFARAGVEDYWIVNLVDHVLEVYRQPRPAPAAAYGARYRSVRLLRRTATVVPLAKPPARLGGQAPPARVAQAAPAPPGAAPSRLKRDRRATAGSAAPGAPA